MNDTRPKSSPLGRPKEKRLNPAGMAFLKQRILENYPSLAQFYGEAFKEAGSPKYRSLGHKGPGDVATVDRAFDAAFSGKRSLPKLYWKVLDELLGITQEDLCSRSSATAQEGAEFNAPEAVAPEAAPTPASPVARVEEVPPAYLLLKPEPKRLVVPTVPHNLPRRDQQLFGRDAEIEVVLRFLSRGTRAWLVSITGVGGVGKTALALEVAHRCLQQVGLPADIGNGELAFDAFVWTSAKQTELDGPTIRRRLMVKPNLPSIVHTILRVVAPEKTGALPPEDRQREIALELLHRHRTLLIVDNLETVDDEQVLMFLKDVPEPSKVIVTDRRAVHESRSLPLMELPLEDAKQLVREQCRSEFLRDRLVLSAQQIDNLARKTGGIPLAIIWTLGRMAANGSDPDTILRQLSDAGSSPVLGFLFDASYGEIRETSRRVLAALALPGTAVRGDMLVGWLDQGPDDTEDALEELKQFALITESPPAGENGKARSGTPTLHRYYRLLPLTREYVLKRDTPLDPKTRRRVHRELLELISEEPDDPDWPSVERIDLIEGHRDLLAWCVQDAHDTDHHEVVVLMVRRLGYAMGIRGYNDLRYRLAALAVDSAQALHNPQELARALITNKAWVEFVWAEYDRCLETLREAKQALAKAKDERLEATALRLAGQVAKESGDMAKAEKLIKAALDLFSRLEDPYQLVITHGAWGSLQRDLGRFGDSEASMREALRLTVELKNAEELKSIMCQKLTQLLIKQGRLPEADEFNQQAETLLLHLRRQMGVAYCKRNKALIAEARGDIPTALAHAKEAEALFAQSRARQEVAGDLQRIQEKADKMMPAK